MDKNSVFEQLNRITKSPEFVSKPVMCSLLSYLVKEYVEGRGDQIKGYSIGVDVFEQGHNFDPDQNALVRINAGRLRRLLKLYYLEEGLNDPVKIDIPKGKYIPLISEQTITKNEVSSKSNDTSNDNSITKPSICVLPFRILGGNSELEYFAFGFAQELSSALTKFDDLHVIGAPIQTPSNIFDHSFREQLRDKSIRFLVEGDLAMFKNEVKLSIRLLNVVENTQVWSDSNKFNLNEENLFDVQEKTSALIASYIGAEYGLINQLQQRATFAAKAESYDEYSLILKYYYHESRVTAESGKDLNESLEKALSKHPDSGVLNAIQADLYGDFYAFYYPDSDGAYQKFGEFAEMAFSLDPYHPIVKLVLGFKCFMYNEKERFFRLSEDCFKTSNNNPLRVGALAMFTCLYGEWEKGKVLLDGIIEGNLEIPKWLYGATCLYYYRELSYEKALAEANKYHLPQLYWGPMLRAATLGQLGKSEEAQKNVEDLLKVRPKFLSHSRQLLGRFIKEESLIEHVIEGLTKAGMKVD